LRGRELTKEFLIMRVDYKKHFPKGVAALGNLEASLRDTSLEPALLELVRIRASQINGCAWRCIPVMLEPAEKIKFD
jgi:hypothetical protein